ncbi:cation-translocating P-type ATPase [Phytoactinopolyspora halotolerans]|uniref:HAD-IC family P-type ATPase n=1 Tax=Phytoactinopolyspora halotolerans TaxID=1981512 RepID=A0A6L9S9D7_9ACTN|nr:cation-translocating P-type ATPase [Phytoactinopolyspora halotolerans]NEE01995.1 HAD-IC family P-type ATPase [Phytoactinopolyspora halotolerans]
MAGVSGAAYTVGVAKGTAKVLPQAATQALSSVPKAASALPRAAAEMLPNEPAREALAATRALTDTHPRRQQRRVWSGDGTAHIDVRGMTAADTGRRSRLAQSVPRALRGLKGVRWAQVNAVTGQVLVAFDEGRVDLSTLLDTVRDVEREHGTRSDDFSWRQPTHPGDATPIAAVATELAADCVATGAAAFQTFFRISPLPRRLRSALALLEVERDLRRGLKRRIGPIETDFVLTLANAAVHGLSQGIATPAVDSLYRTSLLADVVSRRRTWQRREPELAGRAESVPRSAPHPPPRPGPRPKGPIERWNDRLAPLAPGVAGTVLALTRDAGRAADALQAAVPRAARYGREGFATAVGREMSRRGVVTMNAGAYRRLDRVSAVVIDAGVLVSDDGEPDPLADAVLDAAGSGGSTVLMSTHPAAQDLLARVDETIDDGTLTDHVRRLQGEGHGVLVVSADDEEALVAADVGVALPGTNTAAWWSADLVASENGLADVWRVLRAAAVACAVSESSVHLAQAGSALGALHALVAARTRLSSFGLAPVQVAALLALARGTAAGLRATRLGEPRRVEHVAWHELDPHEVYHRLQRRASMPSPNGADGSWPMRALRPVLELTVPGVGVIGEQSRDALGMLRSVRDELSDPLTPVLAVGAVASAVVGSGVDGILVGSVMTGNAMLSGVQRLRAERALRELTAEQEVVARRVVVEDLDRLADAKVEKVPARRLMPGDVIELRGSDLVPADARLLTAEEMEVDESSLTGESMPVPKDTEATPGAAVAERSGMVFDGTSVLTGSAYAVVVATGQATEAGRATRTARSAPRPAGVQARLHEVTKKALPATAIGGAAVTGIGMLRGMPLRDAVAAGVSVAVAAVPEGLPLVATVAQAGGARRLSRQGTLVRASRALEALGRVDVVCFDKTGTLTEGRLRVSRLASADADLDPDGAEGRSLLAAAAHASPDVPPDRVGSVPHATDRAVLEHADVAGQVHRNGWKSVTELPFQTQRGYSATLGRLDDDGMVLAVKGAPESVLPMCRDAPSSAMAEELASDGLRVLAVAERRHDLPEETDDVEPLVGELTLLGFVGIADTPRADASEGVRRLSDAGVRPIMVTGDHPETARATAAKTGIANGEVLTGADLERMPERERIRRVAECTVFARVTPEQKTQIVAALQKSGRVVAMIGDGINDAAAIRMADVGIGVRARRSASAQSAADLVLSGADMRQVHDALLEGRALWRRVRDAVSILVGGNAGEVAFMVLGTTLAGQAPINTRQMLLVNMLTDMFPALAIAVAGGRNDDADDDEPVGSLLGSSLTRAVAVRGGATALGATLAWTAGRWTGRRQRAGTMGLAALVLTQLGQTLLIGRDSKLVVGTSAASVLALIAAVQTPGLSQFLGCTPLGPVAWTIVLGAAVVGTVVAAKAARRGSIEAR